MTTSATDAVQLARCAHVGNWPMFWTIVRDYTDDDSPAAELILDLSIMLTQSIRRHDESSPDEYLDHAMRAAQEATP